ncbi:hypothetical protein [Nocardia sp. NPDC050412]|uniref:hypothetical protein n=1 Tax=Nocardia sp. NPDC050412 TaxID=3364320 RepID=UPI0037AD961E
MILTQGSSSKQVELIGPVAGVLAYWIAGGLILTGPIFARTGESLASGLCPGILTLPIGIGIAFSTYEWRRTEKRFRIAGVAATVEIIAVHRIIPGGENQDTAELRVRISGREIEPFDADCEVPTGSRPPQVGDRRNVVVDPSDNTFAIGYDHLFQQD